MAWTWKQFLGIMVRPDGTVLGTGYSGAGTSKNKPEDQDQHNRGPIPQGLYLIGDPVNTVTHGPFVLPLTPDPGNEMNGRNGFLIHGDSVVHPGAASDGCIVLARGMREAIGLSGDKDLQVIP